MSNPKLYTEWSEGLTHFTSLPNCKSSCQQSEKIYYTTVAKLSDQPLLSNDLCIIIKSNKKVSTYLLIIEPNTKLSTSNYLMP